MSDRFKFRVWNKNTHSFTTGGAIKFGGLCFVDEEDLGIKLGEHQECYIVEQCTGVKDANDNLIYENDIVEQSPSGNKYKIIWIDTDCGWGLENTQTGFIRNMNCFDGDELEIIGNIHETKGGKDE